MKTAIIEVGSVAIRAAIINIYNNNSIEFESTRSIVYDQEGVDNQEIIIKLNKLKEWVSSYAPNDVIFFGTEKARTTWKEVLTKDFPEFIFLTPEEEGVYGWWSGIYSFSKDFSVNKMLSIDCGGQSTEIVSAELKTKECIISYFNSIKLGNKKIIEGIRKGTLADDIFNIINNLNLEKIGEIEKIVLSGSAASKIAWLLIRKNEKDIYSSGAIKPVDVSINQLSKLNTSLLSLYKNDKKTLISFIDNRSKDDAEALQTIGFLTFFLIFINRVTKANFNLKNIRLSPYGIRHGIIYNRLLTKN